MMFTGGAPEFPQFQNVQGIYSMYVNYAMPGYSLAYCEPVSDAWGAAGVPFQTYSCLHRPGANQPSNSRHACLRGASAPAKSGWACLFCQDISH